MRAALFFPLALSLASCTLLNSKSGLVGPLDDAGDPSPDTDAASTQGPPAASEGGAPPAGNPGGRDGGGPGPGPGPSSTDGGAPDSGPTGPVAIYTGIPGPLGIAVYAGTLCWVEGQTLRSIMCAPAAGGSASQMVTAATQSNDALVEQAFDVALDGTSIYWSNGAKNQVVRQPRSGGASAQLFTGDQRVSYIVLEGAKVWTTDYVAGGTSGNVAYGPYSGSQSLLVYPSEKQAAGVATYAGSVYWGLPSSVSIGPESGNATIARVPTPGRVTGLAIDGSGATYFLSDNQSVYRLALGASKPDLVYAEAAPFGDSDLAVDDIAVYWSEHDNGTVMRLAK